MARLPIMPDACYLNGIAGDRNIDTWMHGDVSDERPVVCDSDQAF